MTIDLLTDSDTNSSHYSQSFNPERMKAWAKKAAVAINKMKTTEFKGNKIVLIYTGMSGVSHAMYLSSAFHRNRVKHEHLYIRKAHEKSHGRRVEFSKFDEYKDDKYVLVFVDDFISCGITRKNCIKTLLTDNIVKADLLSKFTGLITYTYKVPVCHIVKGLNDVRERFNI
jgi:orotate phosphoribosyltransferase-like protein